MGKSSLWGIFTSYVGTLRDDGRKRARGVDVAVHLVLPVVVAVGYVACRELKLVPDPACGIVDRAVTLVSIFSAFLCGAAIMVFQLRADLATSKPGGGVTGKELLLVDELYKDMLWAIVAGFGCAALFTLQGVIGPVWQPAGWAAEVLAVALLLNFCLVVCMCLKRMLIVYENIVVYWSADTDA
jgi:hypothetical protein